ncbi:MAG TPA: nucleoside deaminase [Rhodopseudomonas sp.]|uniref:nucleoside deaminase n=1 Tax=Rhodopseudomonas sp. TaxID=1078 RepID=UPI002ED85619
MCRQQPTFDDQVDAQVERLRTKSLRVIEDEVAAKRNAWWDRQPAETRGAGTASPTPRDAFETLFFRYMGLKPCDIPVLRETDSEIVWSSRNPCPTLEACKTTGLDTRDVCRGAYEKSTQALLSRIDPQLRFLRDYAQIRPYSAHCLEKIVRISFKQRMRLAIDEARLSRRQGNKGYGAVAVLGDRIVSQAHDTAVTDKDPSQHAEMKALRQAVHVLGDANLSGVVLFSTCEPCPMCASMAVWSNISAIVFGASINDTVARGRSRITVSAQQILNNSPVRIELYPGILRSECLDLYV